MGPSHLKFGGGVAETVLNPIVLLVILIAGVLICVWPRNKVIFPFLLAAILIPDDQVLLIGPAHFPMLRLLVLFGIIRMLKAKFSAKQLIFSGGMNKIDIAVVLLGFTTAINGVLLFQEVGSLIFQLGYLFTLLGVYSFLRFSIRTDDDIVRVIQTIGYISVFVAVVMTYEITTRHNPYAILGGARVAQYATLAMRDDKIRAQGPFAHSILAGTFGAVMVPLFVAIWWKGKKYRKITLLGIVSAVVMTLACNSSTPVMAYAAGVFALCMWPFRNWMRPIRWGIVVLLAALHMVMKGPVWSLIEKIDISGGSSSFHRYMLVDQCIRRFGEWWLVGVKDTSVWGWDMWDTANQYVGTCENSGLIPFILLITILVYGFKYLGRARVVAGKDKKKALFIWALGSALFANVVAFFGISYFDQSMVTWYALLAMISAVISVRREKRESTARIVVSPDEVVVTPQLVEQSLGS